MKKKSTQTTNKPLTKSNEAEGLSSDSGRARRHLPDLLHALDPRALPESLVQPGVSPVQVEDVTKRRVGRLFYSRWGNVTDGDALGRTRDKMTNEEKDFRLNCDNKMIIMAHCACEDHNYKNICKQDIKLNPLSLDICWKSQMGERDLVSQQPEHLAAHPSSHILFTLRTNSCNTCCLCLV